MRAATAKPKTQPARRQRKQPGEEYKMHPRPQYIRANYKGSDRLPDKTAIITGGDSGIGRAVAVHFAREGADVAIVYYNEDRDARETEALVQNEGRACLLLKGDLKRPEFCEEVIDAVMKEYGKIDILVNNAAEQHAAKSLEDIDNE